MKRRITTIFLVILLISGFGVMAYPWISEWVNASSQAHVIESYQGNVSEMDTEEIAKEKLAAALYDQKEVASSVQDPFAEETNENEVEEGSYASILNVGETMGYLEIPKIDSSLPIYHGTSELVMEEGVGHMEGTSLPVGGLGTHCVLASHSGLPDAKLFTDLGKLAVGDKFYIHVLDEMLTYQVDEIDVVLPSDTSKLEIVPGEDYVTLLTCTPTGTNTHRLLVRGVRIPNEVPDAGKQVSADKISNQTIWAIIWWVIPLMAVAFGLIAVGISRRKK